MAKPILLDDYRNSAYFQNQAINDKLDMLIGEMRDIKQDIRALDAKIEKLDKKIDDTRTTLDKKIDATRTTLDKKIDDTRTTLDKKIDDTRKEFRDEINTARWQILVIVAGAVGSASAVVWAVVSALK